VAFVTGTELHGGTSCDIGLVVHAFVFQPDLLRPLRLDAATELWVEPLEAGRLAAPLALAAASRAAELARSLVALVSSDPPGMELAVKGVLFRFLFELVSGGHLQPTPSPAFVDPAQQIRSVLQFIEEQFAQPLTVEVLAARACLSPSHFSRVFRTFTGDTPIHALIRRRIAEADRLLREGRTSVSQAALQVGFTNFSYFARAFRSQQGVNPSAIRANRKPGRPPLPLRPAAPLPVACPKRPETLR
jgi:AraC-like DNA-binding protein